jgi:hypothetical protein
MRVDLEPERGSGAALSRWRPESPPMFTVIDACVMLIAFTTAIHYEVLRALNAGLPLLSIPDRTKLLVVIFGAFIAHAIEIGVYGFAFFALIKYAPVGSLAARPDFHSPTASISPLKPTHRSASETLRQWGRCDCSPESKH